MICRSVCSGGLIFELNDWKFRQCHSERHSLIWLSLSTQNLNRSWINALHCHNERGDALCHTCRFIGLYCSHHLEIVSQWNAQSRNSRLAFVTFVFDHCSGSARGCPWIWIHNCATTFYTAPTFDKPHPARAKGPTFGSKFKFDRTQTKHYVWSGGDKTGQNFPLFL